MAVWFLQSRLLKYTGLLVVWFFYADKMKMYRRIVSLILLPCVMMSQSASLFGHTHAGDEPAGDAVRPHIHLKTHTHGHAHSHGSHHQEPLDRAPETGTRPGFPTEPLSDHDSDAVYITAVDAVPSARVLWARKN